MIEFIDRIRVVRNGPLITDIVATTRSGTEVHLPCTEVSTKWGAGQAQRVNFEFDGRRVDFEWASSE